ncbi:phosphotransferase enzyme family protein [Paenibacillus daejeonensis]|uniref:phosphotransferase enzyme family protein n=1 Tax=Paenibacillus daejeonensis TaxID=135193 RepID=UPI000381FA4F|nr:aminoglycoside phosphotransferase family protein [Paenibacillus daejeonensis]
MDEKRVIGQGNTATVYAWGENKVLKLYRAGYAEDAVAREFDNTQAIRELDFPKPIAYERVVHEDRQGIIYDLVDGDPLLEWTMRTGDLQECATYLADVHRSLLKQQVSGVPYYKDFLRWGIERPSVADPETKTEALRVLDQLADGDTLCHGDLHPGNILLTDTGPVVIDFLNVCRGVRHYDIARSVYLMQYTPYSATAPDREEMLRLKVQLTDLYLEAMGVTREELAPYLEVIRVARMGENPEEFE